MQERKHNHFPEFIQNQIKQNDHKWTEFNEKLNACFNKIDDYYRPRSKVVQYLDQVVSKLFAKINTNSTKLISEDYKLLATLKYKV